MPRNGACRTCDTLIKRKKPEVPPNPSKYDLVFCCLVSMGISYLDILSGAGLCYSNFLPATRHTFRGAATHMAISIRHRANMVRTMATV